MENTEQQADFPEPACSRQPLENALFSLDDASAQRTLILQRKAWTVMETRRGLTVETPGRDARAATGQKIGSARCGSKSKEWRLWQHSSIQL